MESRIQPLCGLDVHKKTVVPCVLTSERKEIGTFSTMTDDLISMTNELAQR
ncbi:IS110 family transposase [Pelotomaculum terephthalicicum JT]|uniref:IS110 family transposase n=1 Tax=Pelotomaculum terephthalicicum TaxID=206393 RepID=UPI001F044AFC|nr:IS110 family transposase [Pelotomaculum terephthalicicum]MCG9968989.1 IS110 family transposase [Pelotomaculum terephthalicicum JT]